MPESSARKAHLLRLADYAGISITLIWIVGDVVLDALIGKTPFPRSIVDYTLIYQRSREIIHTHSYPGAPYPYPPSAVILQYVTALFPFAVSVAVWMAMMAIAAVSAWWILSKILHLGKQPGACLLLPIAYAFSNYFFHWDLSKQNSNTIFLAATLMGVLYLHKMRPIPAGFWIALGIAMKLFAFLLPFYLLWKRRFREFGWTLLFLALLWLLLPDAVLGFKGSAEVYRGWLEQVRDATQFPVSRAHPTLISLERSAYFVFPTSSFARVVLVNAFRGTWALLFVIAFLVSRNRFIIPGGFVLLSDAGLLLLAPIALSPYLEPYHPVAAAIPGLLLLVAAADPTQSPRIRIFAGACFFGAFLVLALHSAWEVRGLMVNFMLLLATGGAVAISAFANLQSVGSLRPVMKQCERSPLGLLIMWRR